MANSMLVRWGVYSRATKPDEIKSVGLAGRGPSTAPLRITGLTSCSRKEIFRQKKLRGRFRVPGLLLADTSLSASFSSLPFSWLPWFYSPFPFFMDLL
jgi:hypothetical protein